MTDPQRQAGERRAHGWQRAGGQRRGPVRDGILLGLAVGTSGAAFGAAAAASGLSVAQACLLSLLAYTGASQFALTGAVAAGSGLLAGTAGAILLGGRNGLYGLRLAGLLRPRWPGRLLLAHAITDESTALALAQTGRAAARTGFLATFTSLYLTWNLATLAGAAGAGALGSPAALGLDVVGPAAFLALLWPRLRAGRAERGVAAAGAAVAVVATPLAPPGLPVILAASAALAAAITPRRKATSAPAAPAQAAPARAGGPARAPREPAPEGRVTP